MRLWTFQHADIVPGLLAGTRHHARWPDPRDNFLPSYRWMADQLRIVVPELGAGAPVWCWHSCDGVRGKMPTVGTAQSLFGAFDEELRHPTSVLELDVPDCYVLLSSYHVWNRFLDCAIEKKRLPKYRHRRRHLFNKFLVRHKFDDIQAVIPWIDPSWVVRVQELTVSGRDYDEPVLHNPSQDT